MIEVASHRSACGLSAAASIASADVCLWPRSGSHARCTAVASWQQIARDGAVIFEARSNF